MTCSDTNGFGYVEVEKDRLKVVYGDSSNPTIKYFCSDEIVKRYTEYPQLKETTEILKTQGVSSMLRDIEKLKAENEDLQGKLDGDAVTFMNLQKEILELKKPCSECNGTGRFYFTQEKKLEDSQPCGKCNPVALELARNLHTYEKLFKLLVNARPLKSDEANLTLDAKTVLKSLQLKQKVKELVTAWKYDKYEECSLILHNQILKDENQ